MSSTPPGNEHNRATVSSAATAAKRGLTREEYATDKQLPVDFLESLGIHTSYYRGEARVSIPYVDGDGNRVSVRYRHALDGDERFSWKTGSKAMPYGLQRLEAARKEGFVVLVEGESDAQTLWLHDVPAIGIPGAATWSEDRDARALADIPKIYVVVEPGAGGDAVVRWLGSSEIRYRTRLVQITQHGDVSALYLDDPSTFMDRLKAALDAAEPWEEMVAARTSAERDEAWELCEEIARDPAILDRFERDIVAQGVVGEPRNTKLIYLSGTSRVLERPISLAIKGPSSGGKSYVASSVLKFFPDEAYYTLSGMSERALAYSEEPLAHRMLVIYEEGGFTGDFANYLMRSLLSEGHIRYETVEKTDAGLKARLVIREGPTGLIVTTTKVSLHPENETRLLSLLVTDSPEQTSRILASIAAGPAWVDLAPWHALQVWVARGENRVVIPYAPRLAQLIPPLAVRLRRDFTTILALIRAHALLHQVNRDRDGDGSVIATLHDYRVVRDLVDDLVAEGVDASVPETVRETVEAVDTLAGGHITLVTVTGVAVELGLDKSTASRRVKKALAAGYLKNLEDRRGRPMNLAIGDPMPAMTVLLPSPEDLESDSCAVAPISPGNHQLPTDHQIADEDDDIPF